MPFSVLLVDDSPVVRQVLTMLIDTDERLTLARAVGDGLQAAEAVSDDCPDAIVCDVAMPRMDGLEAVPILRAACPSAVIVMYTSDPEAAYTAFELGADDVIAKTVDPRDLMDRIVDVFARRTDPPET